MKRFAINRTLAVACASLLGACGESDSVIVLVNDQVDTLTVTNAVDSLAIRAGQTPLVTSVLTLEVGDVATLSGTGYNALGQAVGAVAVTWESENNGVASVSSAGVVTALSPGSTNIIARAGNVTAVVPTVVEEPAGPGGGGPPPAIGTLEMVPSSAVIYGVGNTRQFTVTARDPQGQIVSSPSLSYATADASIATVGPAGLVTGTGLGTTQISVASSCCSVDTATVLVEDVGATPAPGLVFAADWSTATGKSDAALSDGGRLGLAGFPSDAQLTVVPFSPLGVPGWPTNGLELSFLPSTSSLVGRNNGWPAPNPGESIYYRLLLYHDIPGNTGIGLDHGNQSNVGAIRHALMLTNGSGEALSQDHWSLGFRTYNGGAQNNWYNVNIPKRAPIRVEWRFIRQSGGVTARVEFRIYDESVSRTVPQWTNQHFRNGYGVGPVTLADGNPVIDLDNESQGFQSYLLGISGSGGGTACCIYLGAFAVSLSDWVGPYVPGEANN